MIRGAVLAGGRSSRFGSDKALAPLGSESLLARAVGLVRRLNLRPVIVAPAVRGYGRMFACDVLEDERPGEGPLGGLATLWRNHPRDTFLVLTCDMPGLTERAALTLLLAHSSGFEASVYIKEERAEPFPGVYEATLAEAARRALSAGRRSMGDFLAGIARKKTVRWNGRADVWTNVNSPADLPAVK